MEIKKANVELHVHPFLGSNGIDDIFEAMNKTRLDVVALEKLDGSLYPVIVEKVRKTFGARNYDKAGIRLPSGKYLLNAREYNTAEGLHVLTVGYSYDGAGPNTEIREIIDKGLENKALVVLDHILADNIFTKTAGHISDELKGKVTDLCKEYSGQIALEWNGYCIPWIRRGLQALLNHLDYKVHYHDINKKVEELSAELRAEGYNLPVLADTDLHARDKKALEVMGTARFIIDVEGDSAAEIVDSMKKNIFSGNYKNVKRYVEPEHLLGSFCLPILFEKFFKHPRG